MRKQTIRFLVLLLVVLPLLGVLADVTSAATSRVAVIKELKGTVKVKKAGGAKEFTAFAKMSLNEGDMLSTGKDSYVELQFANGTSEDDRMTVTDNSTLTFSKLSDGKGTRTKVSMLKGTSWFEVKSIKTQQDEFQLETPTAVMGVRGTKVVVFVDPVTGETKTLAVSGVVHVTSPTGQQGVNVYPAQQISLFPPNSQGVAYVPGHPSTVQISDVVSTASPKIIEKIIRSTNEIQEENDKMRQKLLDDLNSGSPNPGGVLTQRGRVTTQEELDRVYQNFNSLIGNLAKEAINQKKIKEDEMKKIIDEANSKIKDPAKKLDLDKVKEIDPGAGVDPEIEKARQQKLEAQRRMAEEQRQLKEKQQRLASLLEKIEADRKAIDDANKNAAKEAAEKAAEQLKSQLNESARKAFEEARKKLQDSTTPTVNSSNGGNPGGGNPGPTQESKLATLSISSGTLNFNPNSSLRNYSVDVAHEVSQVTIIASASTGSTIQINEGTPVANTAHATIPLPNVGAHTVTVKVTEQGKLVSKYIITVNRAAPIPEPEFYGVKYWDYDKQVWVELKKFDGETLTNGLAIELDPVSINVRKLLISKKWSDQLDINAPSLATEDANGYIVDLGTGLNNISFTVGGTLATSGPIVPLPTVTLRISRGLYPSGVSSWSVKNWSVTEATYKPVELNYAGYNTFGAIPVYEYEGEYSNPVTDYNLDVKLDSSVEYVKVSYYKSHEVESFLYTSGELFPNGADHSIQFEIDQIDFNKGPISVAMHYTDTSREDSNQLIWMHEYESSDYDYRKIEAPFEILNNSNQLLSYGAEMDDESGEISLHVGVQDAESITIQPKSVFFPQTASYEEGLFKPEMDNSITIPINSTLESSELSVKAMYVTGEGELIPYKIILYPLPQDVDTWAFIEEDVEGSWDRSFAIKYTPPLIEGIPAYDVVLYTYGLFKLKIKSVQTIELSHEPENGDPQIVDPGEDGEYQVFSLSELEYGVNLLLLKKQGAEQPFARIHVNVSPR